MDKIETEIRNQWNKISDQNGGSRKLKISSNQPLEWYVRYAEPGKRSISVLCNHNLGKIKSCRGISVSCLRRKNDGRYALCFTLQNNKFEDLFITMTRDLIEKSLNEFSENNAIEKVIRRYDDWLKYFNTSTRNQLLSNIQQIGLLGELSLLKELLRNSHSATEVVKAWSGPEGGDRDFTFKDNWIEVKATSLSSTKITISSVEQLDSDTKGQLAIFRIDSCSPNEKNCVSLNSIVSDICDQLKSDFEAESTFQEKLALVGYIKIDEYNKSFLIHSPEFYKIDNFFPRIRRLNLPIEITNIEYSLSIPALSKWKIN